MVPSLSKRQSSKGGGGASSEYEVALQLQREWNNAGNFSRQTKIIIFSNWRSGSSFLGGIFESSKDVMYIYEPFQDLGSRIIRKGDPYQINSTIIIRCNFRNSQKNGGKDSDGIRKLTSLLNCNFRNMSSYLYHEQSNNVGFPRNSKLWRWCRSLNCWTPHFLELFCKLFPVVTLKILRKLSEKIKIPISPPFIPLKMYKFGIFFSQFSRLTLAHSEEMLSRGLTDRVILLVRDPRATAHSRAQLRDGVSMGFLCK